MSDSKDLLADLDDLLTSPSRPKTPCTAGVVIAALPEDVREKVEALLLKESVSSARISQVLERHGYNVSYSSLTRHRRRRTNGTGCLCP